MAFGKKTTANSNADILDQKRNRLNSYNQQFERAVSLITDTIDNLGLINQGIEQTMREIEDYKKELAVTEEGLAATKAKNDLVISNFQSLLAVD